MKVSDAVPGAILVPANPDDVFVLRDAYGRGAGGVFRGMKEAVVQRKRLAEYRGQTWFQSIFFIQTKRHRWISEGPFRGGKGSAKRHDVLIPNGIVACIDGHVFRVLKIEC